MTSHEREVKILQVSDRGIRALAYQEGSKPCWYRIRKNDKGSYILYKGIRVDIPKTCSEEENRDSLL